MQKFFAAFTLGFVVAAALFAFVITPFYGREAAKQARTHAAIHLKLELMEKIAATLGDDYQKSDGYNTLFEVKDTAVLIVERNGVTTLRCLR